MAMAKMEPKKSEIVKGSDSTKDYLEINNGNGVMIINNMP